MAALPLCGAPGRSSATSQHIPTHPNASQYIPIHPTASVPPRPTVSHHVPPCPTTSIPPSPPPTHTAKLPSCGFSSEAAAPLPPGTPGRRGTEEGVREWDSLGQMQLPLEVCCPGQGGHGGQGQARATRAHTHLTRVHAHPIRVPTSSVGAGSTQQGKGRKRGWGPEHPPAHPYRRSPVGASRCRLAAGRSPARSPQRCRRRRGVARAPHPPPGSAHPGRPRRSRGARPGAGGGIRVVGPCASSPAEPVPLTAPWHWLKGSASSSPQTASAACRAALPAAQPGPGSTASLQESCARVGGIRAGANP